MVAAEKVYEKLASSTKTFMNLFSTMESKYIAITEVNRILTSRNLALQDKIDHMNELVANRVATIENLKTAHESIQKSSENRENRINSLLKEITSQKEKIAVLQKRVGRLRSAADEELENELLQLQKHQLCALCSLRKKNTALQCGHVYCSHCLEERLKVRNRKCPGCMTMFSASDRITLYLEDSVDRQ